MPHEPGETEGEINRAPPARFADEADWDIAKELEEHLFNFAAPRKDQQLDTEARIDKPSCKISRNAIAPAAAELMKNEQD